MTDIIKLLPDNIANQIAAGEVVQRPASVVKELLENAVDAGSQNIRLFVKNGGKTLIQVIDDGCGMSETDARMCFERHATSKIREINDLFNIYTLGFRGEAMASIAAVAQVELKTKRRTEDVGTHIYIENSEVLSQEPCACPEGTSIAVKNLFYNVPARRNFLKSNQVELRHIVDEFLRVALANPEIAFSFTNETEEVYHLKSGNLKQRIIGIWGKKYEEALVPIEETTDILTIRGFIGKPDWARKTRGEQFFFANNRFIKNNYLNHALMSAYEGLLPGDAFPFYTIFMTLPPSKIDINVHPTKTEIKFENEKAIYAILQSAIRKSLSQYHIAPTLNFDEEMTMRIPEREKPAQDTYSQPRENSWIPNTAHPAGYNADRIRKDDSPQNPYIQERKNSFTQQNTGSFQQQKSKPGEWEELYKVLSMATPEEEPQAETETLLEGEETRQKPVLQLHQKFIVSSIRSGLMIVQQQLAHERILFEKYLHILADAKSYSQRLLFPEILNLHGADFALLKEIMPEIQALGFELEEFGKNAFMVNGIPVDLKVQDGQNILEKILEDYKNTQGTDKLGKGEKLARAMAKNASIKIGKTLNHDEMRNLIDELFACEMPYYSPDGKPALITISADDLDKKFKKI